MKLKLFLFISFGCLGTTIEIFFTAFYNFLDLYLKNNVCNLRLKGESYIWMFFIYGIGAIVFPLLYNKIKNWNLVLRLITYALIIYTVEFISGFLLETITGECPWKYTTGINILGYIKLDYFLFWMAFGYLLELTYKWLTKIASDGLR
jgi:uncharacterized membrane protein